jgi:hypothetical protein
MTAARTNPTTPRLVNQHNFSTKARPEDFTIKKCEAFKGTIIANVDAGLADSLPTQNAPKDHEWQ